MDWFEKVKKAVADAFKELDQMSKEEFDAELAKFESEQPECSPDTCGGECQGMGWCTTALDFQSAITIIKQ